MSTDQEYERKELNSAMNDMRQIEMAPLTERKEAANEFFEAMRDDPALVAERIGWLFNGDYGYGQRMKARQVLGMSKRANKVASINQLVGAYEWRSPPAMTVAVWKKLTSPQKNLLQRAIEIVIEAAEKDLKENG